MKQVHHRDVVVGQRIAAGLSMRWPWQIRSMLLIFCALSAVDSTAQVTVQAPTTHDEHLEQLLEEQQVSASALPITAAAASQHVTILRREALDVYRGMSVADVLARQAGILVDRSARSGGFGSLYLRGADPSHVVVLIDNIRQNDPLSSRGSAVDLNTLSTDDIERIEIVRGNVSVANAEAMAGLIHIFTRRGAAGTSLALSYGSDGLRGAQASWAGDGLRVSATHREDSNDDGGFNRTRAINGGWDSRVGEHVNLRAAARYSDSVNTGFPDDSGGARYAVIRKLESRQADSRQFSLRADVATADAGSLQIQASTVSRNNEEISPGVARGVRDRFGLPPITSRSDDRRDELQALWQVPAGADVQLMIGFHYQHEHGNLDSRIRFGRFVLPAQFELTCITRSIFAEARSQRGPWTLQAGLRHERPDSGESSTQPMLSLQYALDESRGQWGLSVARSSKLPSFYALGHPLVGNPQLKPERATHREIYYANAAESAWPSRVTLFSARYQNLVDFDSGPPPRLVNRARIDADGVEWTTAHTFVNDWRLQIEGTAMRVRDPSGVTTLRYRPHLQWGAQLDVPCGNRGDVAAMLRHVGRRFDSSIPTGDRWLGATTVLDISLRQKMGPVELAFAIDNVFNAHQDETIGTATADRRLRMSLQWPLR